jgi:hypothetical protein
MCIKTTFWSKDNLFTNRNTSFPLLFIMNQGELEHLKIKTRLINEMFPSVTGEYVFLK